MQYQTDRDDPRLAREIARAARARLRATPYHGLRKISCEYRHGALVLRGALPSFFQKQMAQEAVFDLHQVTQVINEIDVAA